MKVHLHMGIMLEDQEVTTACMVRAATLVTLILCSFMEEVMAMLVSMTCAVLDYAAFS